MQLPTMRNSAFVSKTLALACQWQCWNSSWLTLTKFEVRLVELKVNTISQYIYSFCYARHSGI